MFGNDPNQLKDLLPKGSRIGHINNSKDWVGASESIRQKNLQEEMEFLNHLGFKNEHLDLKAYFGKENHLYNKLEGLDGVWVSGGNTFVLRQAMKLSGFDNIFDKLRQRENFLWAGYSAGVCILCDSLKYIETVDDPYNFPYKGINQPIYDGLGLFNYGILPHYNSNHFESEAIDKEIKKCIENKWLFKALKDGEVIIMKNIK
ncbi:Type 1 glutamine amidotransferase-like domain-containing protein [Pseudopedobacter beijingensis]|uniref:Type 1 glutamine amidotransferase-like domain-containing protein n=1 Tax=Pseudopedobacter beijingensis TaxID=1207056 RepID=A0ABW4IHN4_9SPHI